METDPVVADFIRRQIRAEDDAIMDAGLAGAGQTPPCGVRVRRSLGEPTQVAVDPRVPAWEVHVHEA